MPAPILATKLFIPPARPGVVPRPRLIERLNQGLAKGCKLTLISASAGFGKTTLVSEWIAGCGQPVAWLSLDEADNDPTRFLTYLVAAIQTVAPKIGAGVMAALQSPQPPSAESLLTALLNEIVALPDNPSELHKLSLAAHLCLRHWRGRAGFHPCSGRLPWHRFPTG